MNDSPFIHLRLHSIYSLLEGAMPVKALPALCAKAGMPAVAVTDRNNLFCALEFSETAVKAGVQPIIGCQLDLAGEPPEPGKKPRPPAPVVALAMSEKGYRNLMALSSTAYLDAGDQPVHISKETLFAHAEDVILLTGGADGPLGRAVQAGHEAEAASLLDEMHDAFGDRLYIEIQRHGSDGALRIRAEDLTEPWFVSEAYRRAIPLVATNDVYFPDADMYEAHDAFLCIGQGAYVNQDNRRQVTAEHRFKSGEEMKALFSDLPEAVEMTAEIARRCHWRPKPHAPILPRFRR